MDNEQMTLAALLNALRLVHTEADLERFQAGGRKWNIVGVILALLIFLSSATKILPDASYHFQTHDWLGIASDIFASISALLILFMLPIILKNTRGSSSLPGKILELREQFHDETLVPPVAEQPLPIEAEEIPFGPIHVRPVGRVKGVSIIFIGVSVFFLLVDIFLGAMIVSLLPWLQVPESATANFWAIVALSAMLLLCTIFTVSLFVLAIRLRRARTVIVDEWGLRWTWPNLIKGLSVVIVLA